MEVHNVEIVRKSQKKKINQYHVKCIMIFLVFLIFVDHDKRILKDTQFIVGIKICQILLKMLLHDHQA